MSKFDDVIECEPYETRTPKDLPNEVFYPCSRGDGYDITIEVWSVDDNPCAHIKTLDGIEVGIIKITDNIPHSRNDIMVLSGEIDGHIKSEIVRWSKVINKEFVSYSPDKVNKEPGDYNWVWLQYAWNFIRPVDPASEIAYMCKKKDGYDITIEVWCMDRDNTPCAHIKTLDGIEVGVIKITDHAPKNQSDIVVLSGEIDDHVKSEIVGWSQEVDKDGYVRNWGGLKDTWDSFIP
jgi:hypothetical protein